MEAAAVDKLIEKGKFRSDTALAIAEAIDIAITAANLVTVPVLDARFAEMEKTIVDAKVWAVYLYAGLVIALFSALAVDHHWLVSRQDELSARSDQRLEALEVRSDQRFSEQDAKFAQLVAKLDEFHAQQEAKLEGFHSQLEEIRALVAKPVLKQRVKQPQPPP